MEDNVKKALLDGSATIQTKIEIVKENLFNPDKLEIGNSWNNNKVSTRATFVIEYEPNKRYYIKCSKMEGFKYVSIIETPDRLNVGYAVNQTQPFELTRISSSNVKYLCIQLQTTSDFDVNMLDNLELKIYESEPTILTEKNGVVSWDYEDFRYVKDEGWIGQFVARQVNGVVKNISDDFSMTDKEFVLHMCVKIGDDTNWYNLGNFLVNKVTDDEVNDKTSFEALDYTKKFNQTYVDSITYPCTALELAQNVCEQCGCELGNTDFKHNNWEITGNVFTNGESCREVLKAIGKLAYSWVRVDWDNKVYIDFDSSIFRNQIDFNNINKMESYINPTNNLISADSAGKTIYIKCKQNTKYKINKVKSSRFTIGTTTHEPYYEILCNQVINDNDATELTITTKSDDNYLAVFYYTSYYDTLTEEEILNSLVIKEEPDEYNKINNSNYYSLTTQKEKIGAINRVIIGYKDIEGERTKVEDTEDIEINGVNEITVYDNPLVYSQELREKAIVGAEDLFGLEYLPLETLTVGHPWLKGDELVEVTDMEGKIHKTIPFDRTIQYFGHIKTKINVATNTKINTEYAYESGVGGRLRKTEIMVDKINGQITEVIEEQDETTKKVNEVVSTVEETKQTISSVETTVENITTTTQTSTGGNTLHIIDALESNALEYHIDGKSEQETRSGKNLWHFVSNNSSKNGVSLTYDTNTKEFIFNGTATAQSDFYLIGDYFKMKANTPYAITSFYTGGTINGSIQLHIQSSSNWKGFDINDISASNKTIVKNSSFTSTDLLLDGAQLIRVPNGTVFNNFKIKFQLEIGTEATEYEQYGVSPSPDYPSEIKTVKGIENLFNLNKTTLSNDYNSSYSISNSNKIVVNVNGNWARTKCVISGLNVNTSYTISSHMIKSKSSLNAGLWDGTNYTANGFDGSGLIEKNIRLTLTSDNDGTITFYFYVNYGGGDTLAGEYVIYENLILNEGSTTKPYVPYGRWAKVKITGKNLFDKDNANILNAYINGNNSTITSSTMHKTFFIKCEPNKSYTISKILSSRFSVGYTNMLPEINISLLNFTQNNNATSITITTNNEAKYLCVWFYYSSGDTLTIQEILDSIMIEEVKEGQTKPTEYEPYKEKEVLIDLSKPNLLDYTDETKYLVNKNYINKIDNGIKIPVTTVNNMLFQFGGIEFPNIKENLGKTFTISTECKVSGNNIPRINLYWLNGTTLLSNFLELKSTGGVFTLPSTIPTNATNLAILFYSNTNATDVTTNDYAEYTNIKLFEDYTDYYELSSIGDTKDELNIIDGQVVINKKIDKSILNGNETWYLDNSTDTRITFSHPGKIYIGQLISSHFGYKTSGAVPKIVNDTNGTLYATVYKTTASNVATFKTWLDENNPEVYYKLSTPQQIVLPNVNIPLFEGVNHITLVDDLETTTSIKFLRQTPISGEYATNQQLGETNYNLANTTSKTNENTLNLNATNTNLNNNYYTKPQIDIMNTATTEEITTIKKEVETKITAEDLTIAINQIKTTGATSVETTTGYKFNEEGLSIQKSGSEMSSLLDNDGLVVKRNDTEMLTVRSSGVEAENITVRTYFTIGNNTRAENYKGGTGFFYIGGDD